VQASRMTMLLAFGAAGSKDATRSQPKTYWRENCNPIVLPFLEQVSQKISAKKAVRHHTAGLY
jgi:hypothetical protein